MPEDEIVNLAFNGPGAPAHPRFPVTQGLSGAAVASGETVVVGDVRGDPRYLTTLGSARSEMIVPVKDAATRRVVGTIDVESEQKDAFSDADRAALERCAAAIAELFEKAGDSSEDEARKLETIRHRIIRRVLLT